MPKFRQQTIQQKHHHFFDALNAWESFPIQSLTTYLFEYGAAHAHLIDQLPGYAQIIDSFSYLYSRLKTLGKSTILPLVLETGELPKHTAQSDLKEWNRVFIVIQDLLNTRYLLHLI